MADSIVACPNCGRKYKVAEGSPAGEFQCTSCQTAVTYGETPVQAAPAPAKAVPAKARPAGPGARGGGPGRGGARGGGRRPARGRGRGAAARGGRRGGRGAPAGDYDDGDYGYAPAPASNMGLYITLAVIGCIVVVGGIVLLLTSGDDKPQRQVTEQPRGNQPADTYNPAPAGGGGGPDVPIPGEQPPANTGGNTGGTSGNEREPDTIAPLRPANTDRPAPPIERPDRPGERPVAGRPPRDNAPRGVSLGPIKAPPGDLYGVNASVLRSMARKDPMSIVKDLKHYDDTPANLQAEIDRLCALIADYNAGGKAHRARKRLVQIGRPAMPRILSCFTKTGAWDSKKGMILACYMDGTLREITGGEVDSYMRELRPMSEPDKKTITDTATRWFVWWYSLGYSLDTYQIEGDDDDDDDDGD